MMNFDPVLNTFELMCIQPRVVDISLISVEITVGGKIGH